MIGERFKINKRDSHFSLNSVDTASTYGLTKEEALVLLSKNTEELRLLQDKLYANNKHAVLIIFQAMDAAGKDSTINHVFSGINPQGCSVKSFKHPTSTELSHDYLWRSTRDLPERGMIGVFNRSYYEEVLVAKVHPKIVLTQNLPGIEKESDIGLDFWKERYTQINNYEKRLTTNGIKVIKFFLHLSKDEQAKRFLKRIEREDKNWKFTSSDMVERKYWDQYQKAYEECIDATSTSEAPWYIIPADHEWYMRTIVSEVITQEITTLQSKYPLNSELTKKELLKAKEQLEEELGLSSKVKKNE